MELGSVTLKRIGFFCFPNTQHTHDGAFFFRCLGMRTDLIVQGVTHWMRPEPSQSAFCNRVCRCVAMRWSANSVMRRGTHLATLVILEFFTDFSFAAARLPTRGRSCHPVTITLKVTIPADCEPPILATSHSITRCDIC